MDQSIPQYKLEDGEIICSKCNGNCFLFGRTIDEMAITCPKCQGSGKVDWITNAMGTPKKDLLHFTGVTYNTSVSSTPCDGDMFMDISQDYNLKIYDNKQWKTLK